MNNPERNITHETAIFNLWLNWIVACGALVLPNVVSVYVPAIIVPLLTFALALLLSYYNNQSLRSRSAVCPQLPTIAMRSLILSGIIMLVILLSYSRGIVDHFFESELLNRQIPFLTVLIISPVTLVNALWAQIRGNHHEACRRCIISLGTKTERGFIGQIFAQESNWQRYFLIAISAVLSLVSWGYYLSFYINVNINVPDKFFLGWVPVIFYFISIVYLATRYFTIWAYYYQTVDSSDRVPDASTEIRFLIISGDSIYLSREEGYYDVPDSGKFDTPLMLALPRRSEITDGDAAAMLNEMVRLESPDYKMRFMYYSEDGTGQHNVYHYLVDFPDRTEVERASIVPGKWYNLSQLERMLHARELSPMLAAELNRLYAVTMAFKTYDYDGNRLYRIKNYRPLFRLKGLCDLDVDFSSPHWLRVWQFNEDKPFFRIRRFINRLGGSQI